LLVFIGHHYRTHFGAIAASGAFFFVHKTGFSADGYVEIPYESGDLFHFAVG
jgi:hypothetical protein